MARSAYMTLPSSASKSFRHQQHLQMPFWLSVEKVDKAQDLMRTMIYMIGSAREQTMCDYQANVTLTPDADCATMMYCTGPAYGMLSACSSMQRSCQRVTARQV